MQEKQPAIKLTRIVHYALFLLAIFAVAILHNNRQNAVKEKYEKSKPATIHAPKEKGLAALIKDIL